MGSNRARKRGGRKKKERKASKRSLSAAGSSKVKVLKILELFLRLLIYPGYVGYVLLKTVLVVKPKEVLFSSTEKLSLGYYKSKSYYRKAKKFTLEDRAHGDGGALDDATSFDAEDFEIDGTYRKSKSKRKMKQKKKAKAKLIRNLLMKITDLLKKKLLLLWRLIHKLDSLNKRFVMKIRWTIKTLYELWLDTEKVVYKLYSFPFTIIERGKSFIKDAIEELDNDESYDYEIVPKSPSYPPNPMRFEDDNESLAEIVITKTVTDWPNKNDLFSERIGSRTQVSRGRPQTRQSRFSERAEGTIPSRKHFAPSTNEELIDNYFNTFDAIQPHEVHRNSVVRRRKRKVVTDDDIEYVPANPKPSLPALGEDILFKEDINSPSSSSSFERDRKKPHVLCNEK